MRLCERGESQREREKGLKENEGQIEYENERHREIMKIDYDRQREKRNE